ncbi:NADH-quinone oxidoreductase subunit NuoH [Campylobacter canadensis]|uniref:NADH-quinone oxidoreductase subunit H n=1 Tax=Campylobacter canadensis TaxID=449520 RepID=A0ABS7WPT8_9BACT|nr:NADH-quinone oxidoreductase subunit NuoH [Campylobacter canadensis]MBZ7986791.1 NADH-quinone oxidoreductase subunit NuoH [Campylobacter canadensis]MBZ7995103.1 NADH-quinone oxidoreductase subunit NuoH [Campylobacter canadensis]MBZ7996615.1 NADH-quinone oxidoreductase subunit NuoH [Campylobacter canadensis]MBZ7997828.1 NADH-quinone oxidoreductase subunit NuoH [Campylobacter canadensis]MBZ8000472.1 NADH-quinone oxidoreductase subunit NuoH [Campylobacter canadensis]
MSQTLFFIIITLIKCLLIIAIFAALAGFATYLERKVLGYVHRRLGPDMLGPAGVLQIVPDMIKLFTKEDIIPYMSNSIVFKIAPLISAICAFLAFAAVPIFPEFSLFGHTIKPIVADINIAVLYVAGCSSLCFYAIFLGGMASNNKWALIGGARALVTIISYEGVSGLCLLAIVLLTGSMSFIDINNYQEGGIFSWLIFKQPIAFVLFTIAIFIETNRTPLCLSENDAELVAGYGTEYSGLRWGMFFIGEYASMILGSILISLIFLGGFNDFYFIPGFIAMILKICFVFSWYFWARGAYPHLRADQVMRTCYLILLPLAAINLIITAICAL